MSGPLVVAQVALSLVLVVAAGLFGRTFTALAGRDLGFGRRACCRPRSASDARRSHSAATSSPVCNDAVARVPGVQAAAVSSIEPLGGIFWTESLDVPGAQLAPGTERSVHVNAITPGWFATYGPHSSRAGTSTPVTCPAPRWRS